MMNALVNRYILAAACLLLPFFSQAQSKFDPQPSLDLIERIIPGYARQFEIAYLPKAGKDDVFEIESKGPKIMLRGNNGVAVASAFNYYLKYVANCTLSWNGSNLRLPKVLPVVKTKIRHVSPYKYRYYLNYCTFNYSMSWWDWERWQKEIDWMAMNGINMPLAVTGQNSILSKVYKSLGFTDKELESFFSGPAYFSWFWMGNLDGWGGPLPQSWIKSHELLQKKIVARERAFGMTPVLPAFTGHVPPAFKDKFKQARLKTTSWNGKFPDVYLLDPQDPMFMTIGKKFIAEQTKAYGTDHLYSADTFNENIPPSNDSLFLNNVSRKVYQSMAAADPKAIWVMQGWLFHFSAKFWQPTQIKAALNAVPDDKMIMLDLWSEKNPLWQKTAAYYGKPWIWNMLHNFGGNSAMYGMMDKVATAPSEALHHPQSGKMAGIGLTPEGIEQNPAIYELMLENVWRDKPVATGEWLKGYLRRRYGKANAQAEAAWQLLRQTVYADSVTSGGPESMVVGRPTFNKSAPGVNTKLTYDAKTLQKAWALLISAAPELGQMQGYQYDLVDVSRQVLANDANVLQQQIAADYKNKDTAAFKKHGAAFLELISDMDQLLATRKDFLLGKWLNAAKAWGTTAAERKLYERNARDLITLWGDKDSRLTEYAAKHWSGLLNGYYKKRWEQFFKAVNAAETAHQPFDQRQFDTQLKEWEWAWVNGTEEYTDQPKGNAVTEAKRIYTKYFDKSATTAQQPE